MPTLKWMGRKDAECATKNVVMKILREDKSLSYSVPAALTQGTQSSQSGAKTDAPGRGTRPACPPRDNLLVHGDNLEALHALIPFYAGRVKCIYIDPPYNTGSAFEHYDDNLEHSTWLSMMYPRLKLLWQFLSEDGSIWISIDDDEQAYLKVVCDEIFGRGSFVTTIVWQKRTSPDMRAAISDGHDFVLVYAKNKERFKDVRNQLPLSTEQAACFKNPDKDPRGPWTSTDFTAQGWRPNQMYAIVAPAGNVVKPPQGRCWRHLEDVYKRLRDDKRLWFGSDGSGVPRKKVYLSEATGITPWTWWTNKEVGHNQEAKKEVLALFEKENIFDTPKPERLIQRILTIATNPGDLVLDSFLGSGTTCAVAQKMGRRWIGIEMGEHAKTHCAVRLKKVVDGEQGGISKAVGWKGGGGFRYYELGEAILQKDGTVTADIPYETMAAHVWFTETKRPYGEKNVERVGEGGEGREKSTVLGIDDGVAYALLYNGILGDKSVSGGNVLTKKTLKVIEGDLAAVKEASDEIKKRIVYAEACRLSEDTLMAANIEFRQTPYDLVVRK